MGIQPGEGKNPMQRAGKPTVLAVDDFNMNLLLFKKELSDIINLYTVRSAGHALKVLDMVTVDLIMLDLQMPEMNGFQFLEKLREMPDYKELPVIIVSSNAQLETLEKTLHYGIVDYIAKPFSPDVLRKKVMNALSHGKIIAKGKP